jgi:hypothetical protein
MKRLAWIAVLAVLPVGTAWAQEQPPGDQETPLTPEESLKLLREIYGLMGEAETKLNESASGTALQTEKEVAERIAELLKQMEQSKAVQRAVLEKIGKLMDRSSKKQKTAIDKINELIRRAQR